ncbi:MAG: T9SS type A sorting domain-containing protein [Saprospiraceae bacterium]|nr:T9SS type A sorting domain-containing protein [Saprospiraceae bacterium]
MCQDPLQSQAFCEPGVDAHCTNNMMSYSIYTDFISPLQMARMHHSLATRSSINKFVVHDLDPNENITIDVPTIWEEPKFIWGDVIIEPDAELTIQCKVTMPPGGRIIVKRGARLILDEGWVTSSGPASYDCGEGPIYDRWEGIEVWGNPAVSATPAMLDPSYNLQTDDPGVVIIMNGGIVERAERGVYGQMRGNTWAVQQQHFGGLISVNDGEFRDCRKAVEYISSSPLSIPSTFANCLIGQNYLGSTVSNDLYTFEGVTSWQVSGLTFTDNCQFRNLERAITLGNAGATIQKCTFQLCKYGIYTFMPWANFNKVIRIGGTAEQVNLFKYCRYAILSQTTGRVLVENNVFEDCTDGFISESTSWFNVFENTFLNKGGDPTATLNSGVAGINTGGIQNYIRCNTYQNSPGKKPIKQGVYLGGYNGGSYFDGNNFSCQNDVYVVDQGNIGVLPHQKWNDAQNFNQFSPFSMPNHLWEIFTPDPTLNKTVQFKYFPPTTNCNSNLVPRRPISGTCYDPSYSFPFNFENVSDEVTPGDCSTFGPRIEIEISGCGTVSECLDSFNTRLGILNGYLVPGSSSLLLDQVETAPTGSATLQNLLAASPFLSEDVLATVSVSQMMEADKLNIITSNLPMSLFIRSVLGGELSTSNLSLVDSLNALSGPSQRDQAIQERLYWEGIKLTWMHTVLDSLMSIDDYVNAEALLLMDTSRAAREWLAALYIDQQDWTGLSDYLQNYPNVDQDDMDYHDVLNIGMEFLTQSPGWYPTAYDSTSLYDIALGYSASSGYAKSLLHQIYDVIIDPEFIEYPDSATIQDSGVLRSDHDIDSKPAFQVVPNPSNGQFQLIANVSSLNYQIDVKVYNSFGQEVYRQLDVLTCSWLDLSNQAGGVYYLLIDGNEFGLKWLKLIKE